MSDMRNEPILISTATQRNWDKLNTKSTKRLKHRANKSLSDKHIVPENYIHLNGLDSLVIQVLECPYTDEDIFYCLCMEKLRFIHESANVQRFISEYKRDNNIQFDIPNNILADANTDWLGYLYQSKTPEGRRNLQGQYYTNYRVVKDMFGDYILQAKESFFDPCCGTGAFLMNAGAISLSQLYGIDNDGIAVMIAKANLIALYPDDKVYPNIFCEDYLENLCSPKSKLQEMRFDYIYTNPPWGTSRTKEYHSEIIHSGERASLFFVKAFNQLKNGGKMSFLMPSSILKVNTHLDLRSYIMEKTKIEGISIYNERFNGVFTDYFSITVSHTESSGIQSYYVRKGEQTIWISKIIEDELNEIELNSSDDQEILAIIEAKGSHNLSNSIWALGVVTGDNKKKLKKEKIEGYEAIYTGKDIGRYSLRNPSNYIYYDRRQLQQCAKDEYYRCPEKLVYKFISKTPCFTYDNQASLFLNSANILIPQIPGMSIKTVLSFLNSEVMAYYYSKRFTDIKTLKGNLMKLPFPKVTKQQDEELTELVDRALNGENGYDEKIDKYIYSIYGLSPAIVNRIKKELYGNTNVSA